MIKWKMRRAFACCLRLPTLKKFCLAGLLLAGCSSANENASKYTIYPSGNFPAPPAANMPLNNSENWYQDHDFARWAFVNLSELMPTSIISRGNDPIVNLHYSERNILASDFTSPTGQKEELQKILNSTDMDGFIAMRDGEVIAEAYFNGFTPESRHIVFSVTKSVVGTLAGLLVQEKALDLDETVSSYLPELTESGFGDATIKDLLNMTASTEWNKIRSDPNSLVNINAIAGGFLRKPEDFPFSNTLEFLATLEKVDEHGKIHIYNASHTEALAWVVTRITGKPWQKVFAERIWSKIGAERDAFVVVDGHTQGFATAGFNATLRDLARFGQMLEQDGNLNGSQIVPEGWITYTLTAEPDVLNSWEISPEKKRKPGVKYYKNQFRIIDPEKGEFYASGYMGQKIYVNQSQNFVAVILSTEKDRATIDYHLDLLRELAN